MPSGKKHTVVRRPVENKSIFYIPIAVGSLLFNNPNQFLQFPREEVINLTDGASPFTIEAWIDPTATVAGTWGIIDARQGGSQGTAWVFGLNSTNKILF